MSQLTIVDDALAGQRLAAMRDAATPPERFRGHARALGILLAREALRDLPVDESEVVGPLGPAPARLPAAPVVAVPVLRAGLGLLPGVHDLVPDATVGMVGLERDPESLTARRYYDKVPPLDGAWVLLLEPMLATGGSAADALDVLDLDRAARVTVLAVVATRQAVDRLADRHPDAAVVTGAVDARLDDNGYIVPGLGDFGDRVLGTPHE